MRYPDYVKGARSLAELFDGYLGDWPEAAWDFIKGDDKQRLLRVARAVASEFPDFDVWDGNREDNCLVEEVLRESMRRYEPAKGAFVSLFERNLRQRLKKETARMAKREARRARQEREVALVSQRRRRPPAACQVWAKRLFGLAVERLDEETRTYLRMSQGGSSTKDIALALNVSGSTLFNRYGGDKISRRIASQVRRLVLGLSEEHRHLLHRHLTEDAGLSPDIVSELLRVDITPDNTLPVLEEDALLAQLGWLS